MKKKSRAAKPKKAATPLSRPASRERRSEGGRREPGGHQAPATDQPSKARRPSWTERREIPQPKLTATAVGAAASVVGERETKQPATPKPALKIPSILLEGDETVVHASGPGRKFVLSPEPPGEPAAPPMGQLPLAYGTNQLRLSARDPHCLYARWDISPERLRQYNALSVDQHLILRVHSDQVTGRPVAEIHTAPEAQHSFVRVEQAGATYAAEIGYYLPGRQWISVAASPQATTPPDTVAEDVRVEFAAMPSAVVSPPPSAERALGKEELAASLTLPPPSAKPPAQTAEPRESAAPHLEFPIAWPPTFPFALPAKAPATPSRPKEVSAARARLRDVGATAPSGVQAQSLSWPPGPREGWTAAQEQAMAEVVSRISRVLALQNQVSSAEVAEVREQERFLREEIALRPAEGPELPTSPGAFEILPLPTGGESLEISSPKGGEQHQPAGFWFNINAELVIYGATEPSAAVTIGGRPVPLRADGTFSCRFALPDGAYELPVTAISIRNDQRSAQLKFERHTDYQGEVGAHPQDPGLKAPKPEQI